MLPPAIRPGRGRGGRGRCARGVSTKRRSDRTILARPPLELPLGGAYLPAMKIALDPYMHRHLSLREIVRLAADLGYAHIELSPRSDFLDWWVHPRAHRERVAQLKGDLREHG